MVENKVDVLSLSLSELEDKMIEIGEKKFRAKQIFSWLHNKKVTDFGHMTNLSVKLMCNLNEIFEIKQLNIEKKLVSDIDNTVKYLYRFQDGEYAESVLMEYKHGNSICVSTQVGCRMGCTFCASAIAGFVRNLAPSEILLQIYEAERDSGKNIDNIVLMGIGEPLDNYENVVKMLQNLKSSGITLRRLSLSTCGLADKIHDLAKHNFGLTLSISLHTPDNHTRSNIMPVNKAYSIDKLMEACRYYFNKTGRRISFEYALIKDVNDSRETAIKLIELLKGLNCHVNLIPVNNVEERDYKKSANIYKFQEILVEHGVNATIRRTLGADINAACGQLRRESVRSGEEKQS